MSAALIAFAVRYNVATVDAYVLPALFERTAQKLGRAQEWLVREALENGPLGEYLAGCAATVAREDRA